MNKLILLFLAGSLLVVLPKSHADATVVTRESFLKHRETFLKRGARRKAREQTECEQTLKGELIEFVPKGEADLDVSGVAPKDSALLHKLTLDPNSEGGKMLRRLQETTNEGNEDEILQIRQDGLNLFVARMTDLINFDFTFTLLDIKNFSTILRLSTKNIFPGKIPGKNPIASVAGFFKQDIPGFGPLEKYSFLSAILTGVDLKAAVAADPEFVKLIELWQQMRGQPGLSTDYDSVIDFKIKQLPRQTG